MSRKKTDSAHEYRITLGDLERREMREVLTLAKKQKKIQNITSGVKGAAVVTVAGAGVYVGYLGVLAFVSVKDELAGFWETIVNAPVALWNWGAGSKTCTDPETGEKTQCPKTHNGVDNPLSGWPVAGGLFNLGMWAGNTDYLQDLAAGGHVVAGDEPAPSADWNAYVAANPELDLDPDFIPGPSWVREAAEAEAARAAAEAKAEAKAAAEAAAAAAAQAEIDAQEAAGMPCPGAPYPHLPCNDRKNRGW